MVPPWGDGRLLKTAYTLYQIDSDFSRALNEYLPTTKEELTAFKKKYDGTHLSHIGKILLIQQVT